MPHGTTDTPLSGYRLLPPGPGVGSPDDRRHGGAAPASVAGLRELIRKASPDIVEAGADTSQRIELSHQLRRILAELAAEPVDLASVRDRWKRVRDLLGPLAGTSRVAQITDQLIGLLRASVGRP